MVAVESPVVVCTYPARDQAEVFVALLRQEGIATVVVPSDHHGGEWDVLVPARDADRVHQIVNSLLAPH
jgi:hypothetical protein